MVSTTDAIAAHRVLRSLGIVQGVGRQSHEGGGLALGVALDARLVEGYETAFGSALRSMMQHALAVGANAIVGVRCEVTAWADGVPAVVAYGTAVRVEVEA